MNRCRITFQPGDKVAVVAEGTDLLAAAITAGLPIYSSCGGEGVCGRCKVRARGAFVTEPRGQLSEEERAAGYVLACRTTAQGDVEVEAPPESRMEREQILTETARVGRLVGLFSEAGAVERDLGVGEREVFT
ncbi:2Fe-2S iron-sulfur cluster binding domain-containing protein, partial [bacterium]|nr:2Fe-2S iron-sulfur cluster binding domain-containing protein [bacterium]